MLEDNQHVPIDLISGPPDDVYDTRSKYKYLKLLDCIYTNPIAYFIFFKYWTALIHV